MVGIGHNVPEPVAMIDHTAAGDQSGGAEVVHYLLDILGSVVGLTNAAGDVMERYEYDPYGRTFVSDVTAGGAHDDATYRHYSRFDNPLAWTGQRHDPATSLYHFWARSYSPRLGRWLHRDPLGYINGPSLYEYDASAPTTWVDPYGLLIDVIWDVGMTVWDAGVVVKNGVESAYGAVAVVYHDVTGNEAGMARAYDGLAQDASELGSAAIDVGLDVGAAIVPGVPAGVNKVIKFADDGADLAKGLRKADNVADAAKGTGRAKKVIAPEDLPGLDATGKVHGKLPSAEELGRYSRDELDQLLGDLQKSIQERIRKNSELGYDAAHAERQAAEQALAKQIEKRMCD